MTCEEFRHQVAALALGALEPPVEAACLAHLNTCESQQGCREAYDRARATAVKLGLALPPARPGANVWRAIERRVGLVDAADVPRPQFWRQLGAWSLSAVLAGLLLYNHSRQLELEDQLARCGDATTKVRTYAARTALALENSLGRVQAADEEVARVRAAASGAIACMTNVQQMRGQLDLQRDALRMLERPSARVVALQPQGGSNAVVHVVFDPDEKRAIVVARALPLALGGAYRIWLMHGLDPPELAGFLTPEVGGAALGEIDRRLLATSGPQGMAISLEALARQGGPGETVATGATDSLSDRPQ